MSRLNLKLAPAALSVERVALAEAIAEAAPKRAAADKARAAAEAARGSLALACDAVPAAERAAEAAKTYLVENPHAPRVDLRAARQAAADAVDDLAIAREVSARADAAEVDAARSARYAAETVASAIDAVLAAAFPTAIEAAERAARHAAGLAYVAIELGSAGNLFNGERNAMMSRAQALNPHIAFGRDGSAADAARAAAAAPWHAARAALVIDPAAPLPEVP